MPRLRVSTTVDAGLLTRARQAEIATTDAGLLDAAFSALLDRQRAMELDAAYAVYEDLPLDTEDDWGDLASFRDAAAAS